MTEQEQQAFRLVGYVARLRDEVLHIARSLEDLQGALAQGTPWPVSGADDSDTEPGPCPHRNRHKLTREGVDPAQYQCTDCKELV